MNYYIQGCAAKADKIKAAFERLGLITDGHNYDNDNFLYFTYDLEGGGKVISSTNVNLCIASIIKSHPDYKELELPVEPKFKVGDNIKTGNTIETIAEVGHATRSYYCESGRTIYFENQDLWHLVPKPHYDIASFQPFDKVLVRDEDTDMWTASLYSNYDKITERHFVAIDSCYSQCVPFEGNENLLGTTDMPDERFINW